MKNKASENNIFVYNIAEQELWMELAMGDQTSYDRVEELKAMIRSYNDRLDIPESSQMTNAYRFATGKSNGVDFNEDWKPLIKSMQVSIRQIKKYSAEDQRQLVRDQLEMRLIGIFNSYTKDEYLRGLKGVNYFTDPFSPKGLKETDLVI